jgi:superoxide dismutase, Fe-Mn family
MFILNPLPFDYDALSPYIGADTLDIHHGKHHQAYVDNLNKTLAEYPELLDTDLTELLKNIDTVPANIKQAVINNAGQVYNHNIYWESLSPAGKDEKVTSEALSQQLDTFGSYEQFMVEWKTAGTTQFGSGWVWLVANDNGTLSIEKTGNADAPIMHGKNPIMTMDVWEHAYYLDYQNKRPDYIDTFFKLINWTEVSRKYALVTQ